MEGMTQRSPAFRDRLHAAPIFTEAERQKNLELHAILGIHPIYRREVEISGIADYADRALYLYEPGGEKRLSFDGLDPSYVAFLEQTKRISNVKSDVVPLSSVALKLADVCEPGPELPKAYMHVPEETQTISRSRKTLMRAFIRNMEMTAHLMEEMEKQGLLQSFDLSADEVLLYCESNSFDFSFDKATGELEAIAEDARTESEIG